MLSGLEAKAVITGRGRSGNARGGALAGAWVVLDLGLRSGEHGTFA